MCETLRILIGVVGLRVLAQLIESYLTGYNIFCTSTDLADCVCKLPKKNWFTIGFGGHFELISRELQTNSKKFKRSIAKFLVLGICASGDVGMIQMLIAHGITDLSRGLSYLITLGYDSETGRKPPVEAAKLLLSLDDTRLGRNTLSVPIVHSDYEMCKILTGAGYEIHGLLSMYAGTHGDIALFNLIGNPGVHTYVYTISYASGCKKLEYIKNIISITDEALRKDVINHAMRSVIHSKFIECIQLLLSLGADPNIAFSYMCKYSHTYCFDILIAAGATECDCEVPIEKHTRDYVQSDKFYID